MTDLLLNKALLMLIQVLPIPFIFSDNILYHRLRRTLNINVQMTTTKMSTVVWYVDILRWFSTSAVIVSAFAYLIFFAGLEATDGMRFAVLWFRTLLATPASNTVSGFPRFSALCCRWHIIYYTVISSRREVDFLTIPERRMSVGIEWFAGEISLALRRESRKSNV